MTIEYIDFVQREFTFPERFYALHHVEQPSTRLQRLASADPGRGKRPAPPQQGIDVRPACGPARARLAAKTLSSRFKKPDIRQQL
jgi:hypothetical protein